MPDKKSILTVRNLKTYFPVRSGFLKRVTNQVRAVDGVDLDLYRGETVGLVGESGCGKTTLARSIIRLLVPTEGSIEFSPNGKSVDLAKMRPKEIGPYRPSIQYIFQDPFSSLNERMTVERVITEPLMINEIGTKSERHDRALELIEHVGLTAGMLNRFPNEFSGGQRQRIVIARSLALEPQILLCDEPVSALDVSVQAQVLNLLRNLQREFNFSYILIAHDLSVVDYLSDRIMIMYLGRIVETGNKKEIYNRPRHPYTEALLASIPVPDPRARKRAAALTGGVPDPANPPSGCHFHPRCPYAVDDCRKVDPVLVAVDGGGQVACIRAGELALKGVAEPRRRKTRKMGGDTK